MGSVLLRERGSTRSVFVARAFGPCQASLGQGDAAMLLADARRVRRLERDRSASGDPFLGNSHCERRTCSARARGRDAGEVVRLRGDHASAAPLACMDAPRVGRPCQEDARVTRPRGSRARPASASTTGQASRRRSRAARCARALRRGVRRALAMSRRSSRDGAESFGAVASAHGMRSRSRCATVTRGRSADGRGGGSLFHIRRWGRFRKLPVSSGPAARGCDREAGARVRNDRPRQRLAGGRGAGRRTRPAGARAAGCVGRATGRVG